MTQANEIRWFFLLAVFAPVRTDASGSEPRRDDTERRALRVTPASHLEIISWGEHPSNFYTE